MFIYYFLLLFLFVLWAFSKSYKLHPKYFVWIMFFLMTCLLGFRGASVGEDTEMYIRLAKRSADIPWKDVFSSFPKSEWQFICYGTGGYSDKVETVYLGYCKLIVEIFRTPQAVLFITAALTNGLIAKFILDNAERHADMYMITFAYMCESLFMFSFNGMRQMLAFSIALQAVTFVSRRQYKKTCFGILAGMCFHLTAIVMVVPVFLKYVKNGKKWCYISIATAIALVPLIPAIQFVLGLFSARYLAYMENNFWQVSLGGTLLLWLFILITTLLFFIRGKATEDNYFLLSIMALYLGCELVAIRFTMFSRVSNYFRFFIGFFLCSGASTLLPKNRWLYRGLVIFMLSASFLSYAASPARYYIPFWRD